MARSNPDITPDDDNGVVEGDLIELLLRPQDVDQASATMSAVTITIKNGDDTTTKTLSDLSDVTIDTVAYKAVSFTAGPGLNQIQAEATGDVQATDLAYIIATAKPNA